MQHQKSWGFFVMRNPPLPFHFNTIKWSISRICLPERLKKRL